MNRPNSVLFLTSPSTSVPTGKRSAKDSQGFDSVCFEAQRDAALDGVDLEHLHLDLLAGRHDLAGVDVLLGPRHLGHVDQALDPRLELHEGAVVGDVGHAAFVAAFERELIVHTIPRIGLKLLHAERDTLGIFVHLHDLNLQRLADAENFGRVVHTAPCHIRNV